MLPDAEDGPAAFPQGGIYATVAGLVARDLGQPEGGAGPRPGGVFRAAVPEAAVDEDGGFQPRKNEVWFARKCGTPSPPRDAVCPKNLNQSQLSAPVA